MKNLPRSVFLALWLILFNALIWLGFGLAVAAGAIPSIPAAGGMRWIMAALAVGSAAFLAGLAFFLRRHSRPAYYLALGLLAVIAVLALADQVGLLDVAALVINLVPLGLLLKDRVWYLGRNPGGPEPPDRP
jgi:hypothetical protein